MVSLCFVLQSLAAGTRQASLQTGPLAVVPCMFLYFGEPTCLILMNCLIPGAFELVIPGLRVADIFPKDTDSGFGFLCWTEDTCRFL